LALWRQVYLQLPTRVVGPAQWLLERFA